MPKVTHQLYPEIILDTDSARENSDGSFNYNLSTDGGTTFAPAPSNIFVGPGSLVRDINTEGTTAYVAVDALLSGVKPKSGAEGGIFSETIGPALQRTPANILGAPADLANLALTVPDTGINFLNWAFGGFEGDMPDRRYLSSDPRNVIGGSEQIARGMEVIGDVARAGTRATQEAGLNVTIPDVVDYLDLGLGGKEVGARTPFDVFSFDTSPDESTKTRTYISLITQIAGAAPAEGAAIAKLARELAKTSGNPTSQKVYEALSDLQTKSPKKAATLELGAGTLAGTGMITSLEALEAAYPNAPQWMKNTVLAGGGVAAPVGVMTVGSTVYDVALKTPIVRFPLKVARVASESLTPSGAERAAARSLQKMGGDWKNRDEILGVMDQLKLALAEGRNIDEVTRIAFTTPQLARNEARVLEAQLNAAEKNMPSGDVAAQRQLIQELRRFADFQEGHLAKLTEGGNVGAIAYSRYSDRLMERRDRIFAALDEAILKLDLGGRASDDASDAAVRADYDQGIATGNFEYNINRLRAFQEGQLRLDPEKTQAVTQAYESTLSKIDAAREEAILDAQERVQAIRDSMPEKMSDAERADFNMWIRREIDTAYKEIDSYEDILWNNISGMDSPKTSTVTDPDGTDLGPQILIDGVPIGEHFAAKVAALQAGEAENQSKYLWKLSGRDALVKEQTKGGGPDAEKVAKQNVVVKNQEAIVAERQRELDVATENLSKARQTEFNDPKVVAARAEVAKLEAELAQIPTGQTIEDPTVIRRINAANQKLAGARAKLEELSKQSVENPGLKKAQDAFEKAQSRLNESQIKLETARGNLKIALGDVDFEGTRINLEDEISDSSILGVRMVDGVPVGRSGQEVQNIISLLKKEMSFEQGRPVRNAQKVKAIGGLIDDLQRAISDGENFSIDTVALDAARRMTAAKKELFERGSVGQIRGFTTKGEPQVQIERTIDKIAPATGQETSLRQLQAALTRVAAGADTPFRLVQAEDGSLVAQLDPDFNLQRYAEAPPAPFESIQVDGGRSLGLKVSDDTPATEANIEIIRNTLWDRFRAYDDGDNFDVSGAARWIEKNRAAINWLKNATGEPTGFEDLVSAERVVNSMRSATKANLDRTVETMRKNGAFNEDFTEEGFRILVNEAAKRESKLSSAAVFLDEPDPIVMGRNFVDRYLGNPSVLDETLKVLENGALPDGTNPALDGFKLAVAQELVQRGLTGPGDGSSAAREAQRLSQSLGTNEIRVWDPQRLFGLSQDPAINKLLGDLFGTDAAAAFAKVAEGARLQQAIGPSAAPGITVKDLISDEWAGNVGRFIGGWTAKITPISSLVLTGLGRRYGVNVIGNVRGQAMENLIVEFLMDPKLAMAAIEKWPTLDPKKKLKPLQRAKLWAHQRFISDNARRIERLSQRPGTVFEIGVGASGAREPDEDIDEPGGVGDQSSVAPVAPPTRQISSAMPAPRAPAAASTLSQVNPVAPRPMGQPSQQTLAGLNQLGLPLFAAKEGGYISRKPSGIMSIKKNRQIVG